ncbi:hypothetical protein NP493_876g01007 [Ridgeia piscesae]|uniref:Uncharacterized protein n=1 Tax=Ridgeia piscesae TaxID=27915 RepID=A0AAD9KKV4_RIDPI|nr:hypothetical protein NP493_876g01007 [Ridgeia piscesae]
MAERYTRQPRRNNKRKDVRLVEVPPALFTCTNTGSAAPSSTTSYDEQTRTMMLYDDTNDDFGNRDLLTPTFPYRQCYETGRPYLYSQQQVSSWGQYYDYS